MPPLRWHLPHGVLVAMSTIADGDLRQATARTTWCAANDIPAPRISEQVHGAIVLDDRASRGPGDAVVSRQPLAALGVFGADCPPLVLAAPDALAVAHCGWRGTVAGIVHTVVSALAQHSRHPPASWNALVGPGVHPDDYEVDAAVLDAIAWPAGTIRPGRPGHAWLDLPGAVAAMVATAGIGMVARSPLSTSRDVRLRSYRTHGPGFPQLLVAWRTSCAV